MSKLEFETYQRSRTPNDSAHRRGRFKAAWRKAVAGEDYGAQSLERLTWDNLGWRLGKLFGETSEERMDELYDWCVSQQAEEL